MKFLSVGLLAVIASPALAQAQPTQTAQTARSTEVPSADSSDVNRVVCKRQETIGSRLAAKKVCLTVEEWEVQAKANRDMTNEWQRLAPGPPSG